MRTPLTFATTIAAATLALAACSPAATEEATPEATDTTTSAVICAPVAGDSLVVLTDDLQLQNSDNLIPAVNAAAADDAVIAALDAASAALDTTGLIALNKAVDIDRETSADAAAAFVADNGIAAPAQGEGSLVVGAFNFSESITVAEIYAAVLTDAGYTVEVRAIGNRETVMPALISGEIHVVPEYAATAAEFLNRSANGADAAAVASGDIDATVAALTTLGTDAGLAFGAASAAQDQNAFAVTAAFAAEYGVTSLSELAETCSEISLGGPAECPERPFCQLGLEETYGLNVTEFSALDVGGPLTKTALTTGVVAVGLVFSSDGSLG